MSVHDVFQAQQSGEQRLAKVDPERGRIMQGFQEFGVGGPFRHLYLVYNSIWRL